MRRWLCAGQDVDLDKGIVRVSGTLARLSGELVVSEPKTARDGRALPLTPVLVSLLKGQRTAQAADKLRAGSLWVDSGMVFTSETEHRSTRGMCCARSPTQPSGRLLHPASMSTRYATQPRRPCWRAACISRL